MKNIIFDFRPAEYGGNIIDVNMIVRLFVTHLSSLASWVIPTPLPLHRAGG